MIQKATEMGAGTIQPVMTQFTQVRSLKAERLRADAIEAAEQCEVLSVPEIAHEVKLTRLIADWAQMHPDRTLVLADEGESAASPVGALKKLEGRPVGLLIGPEGGFSEEERALLRRQEFVVPISLGSRILRADTAAVAALALIQSIIGDWR
jgi:16S rRNA (uracil1498-N3)-methyltransferase